MNNDIGVTTSTLSVASLKSPPQQQEKTEPKTVNLVESKKFSIDDIPPHANLNATSNIPQVKEGVDMSSIKLFKHSGGYNHHGAAERHAQRNAMGEQIDDLRNTMQPLYEKLKNEIENELPSLAGKSYGISVDEKGDLTFVGGSFSESQNKKLSELNSAGAFKDLANDYADSIVKWVELDRSPNSNGLYIGNFDVSKNNFHEIIDIGATLKPNSETMPSDYFTSQIINKADFIDREKVDEYVNGEWINIKA